MYCETAAGYICPFAFVKHVDMPTHKVSPFYPPPFPSPQLPPHPLAPHSPPQFVPKFVTNWKNNLKTRVCAYPMPLGMPDCQTSFTCVELSPWGYIQLEVCRVWCSMNQRTIGVRMGFSLIVFFCVDKYCTGIYRVADQGIAKNLCLPVSLKLRWPPPPSIYLMLCYIVWPINYALHYIWVPRGYSYN